MVKFVVDNIGHARMEVKKKAVRLLQAMFMWASLDKGKDNEGERSRHLRAYLEMYRVDRGYESIWSHFLVEFKAQIEKYDKTNKFDIAYLSELITFLNEVLATFTGKIFCMHMEVCHSR